MRIENSVESSVLRLIKKKNNKYYSKLNRSRKKEYVKELEEKIEELENKIQELTKQVDIYQSRIYSVASGQEKHFSDFIQSRDYYRTEFIDFTQKITNLEGIQQFKEIDRRIGPKGEERRKFLKERFR